MSKYQLRHFICVLVLPLLMLTSCASLNKQLRAWFGKDEQPTQAKAEGPTRFSKQDDVKVGTSRKYRMTKDRMEQEAGLGQEAGSLWAMEGQSAYLFSPNTTRLPGDFLNVKLDGAPQKQLQTKVHVIAKLLDRIDHPDNPLLRGPASTQKGAAAPSPTPAPGGATAPGAPGANQAANGAPGAPPADDNSPPKTDAKFDVQSIPTKVTEILKDGSYRVKGMQSFMIGKREYKAIVTGIVRPEDFSDDGINASKLLDGQFDIVNNKKVQNL